MDNSTGLFFAYGANLGVQFADSYLTQLALSKGMKEGNPITAALIKKLGVAGAGAVKFGAVPIAMAAFGTAVGYPALPNALMAAVTLPVVIYSIVRLKKMGVSISF